MITWLESENHFALVICVTQNKHFEIKIILDVQTCKMLVRRNQFNFILVNARANANAKITNAENQMRTRLNLVVI